MSASQTKTKSFVDETALTFKPLPSPPLTQKAVGFPYCISVSLGLYKKEKNTMSMLIVQKRVPNVNDVGRIGARWNLTYKAYKFAKGKRPHLMLTKI